MPTSRGAVHAMVGGSGPPLLLLHGYPQTHLMWHAVAPLLAERLHGRGHRPAPATARRSGPRRRRTTRRTASARWPRTRSQAMAALGFERFAVAGHDRGGRVAYRMALDHPDARRAARGARHRADRRGVGARRPRLRARLLALGVPRPAGAAARAADRRRPATAFFDSHVRAGMGLGREPGRYPAEVLGAYRRALDDPGAVEAMCEDYRAGATVDVEHDDADREAARRIACPVLVLWGGARRAAALLRGRARGRGGRGRPTSAAGRSTPRHFLAEDRPRRPRPGCSPSSPHESRDRARPARHALAGVRVLLRLEPACHLVGA